MGIWNTIFGDGDEKQQDNDNSREKDYYGDTRDIHGNPYNSDIHGNRDDNDVYGNRPTDVWGNPEKDIWGNEK